MPAGARSPGFSPGSAASNLPPDAVDTPACLDAALICARRRGSDPEALDCHAALRRADVYAWHRLGPCHVAKE